MGIFGKDKPEGEDGDETNLGDQGDNGAGAQDGEEGEEGAKPTPPGDGNNLSQRLSAKEQGNAPGSREDGDMGEKEPLPFDLSQLRPEQLQTLKQMLAATPDRITRKKKNPTIRLREIDGKIIIDFKTAFKALVRDEEQRRDIYVHKISVKFLGEEGYEHILYKTFIQSKQVVLEVVSSRSEKGEIVEGEVMSKETGTLVEMVVKVVKDWFTVKLPDGNTVEIEARIANG